MSNTIYRIDYKLDDYECRLEIIPAHDSNLSSPTYADLDQNFILAQNYNYEIEKAHGLSAPTMSFEFDLSKCSQSLADVLINFKAKHTQTWYPDEVLVPGWTGGKAESTINWDIQLYNIFNFYIKHPDSPSYQIIYSGLQQNGLDGNFKDNILSIETSHVIKHVLTNYLTEFDKEFWHYYTHYSRTAIFDSLISTDNASRITGLYTPADRTEADWYFWFGKVTDLNEYRNKILEYIYYRLTRQYTTWIGIDHEFKHMQFYEQNYDEDGAPSTALNDTSLFTWNYYATEKYDLFEITQHEIFPDGLLNKGIQDKYSNLWDYYVDMIDSYPRFGALYEAGLTILPIYNYLDADSIYINQYDFTDVQFDSPELVDIARSSYVERVADDNDKTEIKNTGNRAGDNYVLPVPFRTSITDDSKRKGGNSGWLVPAKISPINGFGIDVRRTFERRVFNIYCFDGAEIYANGDFVFAQNEFFKVHDKVELKIESDIGTNIGATSNDITPYNIIDLASEYDSPFIWTNAIASDVHNRTGIGLHMADLVSKLYYSDTQNTISGTIKLNKLWEYDAPFIETGVFYSNNNKRKAYLYNPNNLSPKSKNLFTNYDDKYYIKSIDVDFTNGNCDITLLSRGAYA